MAEEDLEGPEVEAPEVPEVPEALEDLAGQEDLEGREAPEDLEDLEALGVLAAPVVLPRLQHLTHVDNRFLHYQIQPYQPLCLLLSHLMISRITEEPIGFPKMFALRMVSLHLKTSTPEVMLLLRTRVAIPCLLLWTSLPLFQV